MTTDAQIVCPCCERPLDDALPVTALRHMECGPVQSRILDALIRAYPRFVTLPSLVHAAYGDDPNGGPMAADSAIQTHIGKTQIQAARFRLVYPVVSSAWKGQLREIPPEAMRRITRMFNQTKKGASRKPEESAQIALALIILVQAFAFSQCGGLKIPFSSS